MMTDMTQSMPINALIVEDVESDALLLVDNLEAGGMSLNWQRVDTEPKMLAALRQPWDIVFSDFSMPSFSGADALKLLRQHDPDIPLIFVSGTIGEDSAVEAMKSGAQDYVMKGNLTRLQSTVKRELREAQERRSRRKTEETLSKLSQVVKQAADSVFITDTEGHIEYVNPAFMKLTGYDADEVNGLTPALLRSGHYDKEFYQKLWDTVKKGNIFRSVLINRRKNGELFHEEKVIAPLFNSEGKITHYVSTGRDITERKLAENEREKFASVLEATPDLVAILTPNGKVLHLNGSGRLLLRISEDQDISGCTVADIFPEAMAKQLVNEVLPAAIKDGIWSGETAMQLTDEIEIPFSQVMIAHRDSKGTIEYLSTIARDITERKVFESELQYLATHDALTKLPNRFCLVDRFIAMLQYARRQHNNIAVMFLDLDNFKRVNDSLGHDAGDILLKQVAQRLVNSLRPNDTVARLGGDEFSIIIGDLDFADSSLVVLRKLLAEFERPIIVGKHELYVTFSTGIAIYPGDGERVEDLLRHADTAMYKAKSIGVGQYRFYAPDMNARGHELLLLEADLQHALEHNEFCLYYQPQVNIQSGCVSGAEALIRWQHPKRGLVSPADFIPLLESSGLIIAVGEWVLREACQQHKKWCQAGFNQLRISVNVSAVQFSDEGLLDKIQTILREEKMPTNMLELEITENVVMHDPHRAIEILQSLSKIGVRTAIDDFGTGYSSLAYLKKFPLNVLKIDQAFVRDICDNSDDAAIVEASISLAQKLNLEIVAEGVETAEQLAFLSRSECDMVQGYHFSRPVPAEEIMRLFPKVWRW